MQAGCRGSKIILKTGLLWCLVVLVPSLSYGAFPGAWKNVQRVHIEQAGLVKFSVPIETIDAARPNLADLRLYDGTGNEIPFMLERPVHGVRVVQPVRNIRTSVALDTTVVELSVDMRNSIAGMTIETPSPNFIKSVQIEGSQDREDWEVLARGEQIFRLPSGANKLYVEIPPGNWPYLRLTLDDRRSAPMPVTGVFLHASEVDPGPAEDLPVAILERNESPHETHLTLQTGGSNVTLAGLSIETPDALFTRPVTLSSHEYTENAVRENILTKDTLFRVALEAQPSVSRLTFATDVTIPSRELLVTIQNGDSPPLQITGIRAQRRPVYLTFVAVPGDYYCLSGNPQAEHPLYDLGAQKDHLAGARIVSAGVEAISSNPDYLPTDLVPDIPAGSAIDLGKWKYRKPLRLSTRGVQQLDLDLEVLSHSSPTLRDLRLIHGGKQLPFLVESTSISRHLTPEVSGADDPKMPKVSRWAIVLPLPHLPVNRLSISTNTPYFKRDVTLYDEAADERGVVRHRLLGSTRWTQTPERKGGQFTLSLGSRPEGKRLMLEIENGDNLPLQLENIQAWYTVTRLLFKTPDPKEEIFLYYGNDKADSPRYELDLIASQMLAADKSKAESDSEQDLSNSSWAGGVISGSAGVIFWTVLVLVVAVLLFVIVRLLPPKPPAGDGK
jgi:hypothetical protein